MAPTCRVLPQRKSYIQGILWNNILAIIICARARHAAACRSGASGKCVGKGADFFAPLFFGIRDKIHMLACQKDLSLKHHIPAFSISPQQSVNFLGLTVSEFFKIICKFLTGIFSNIINVRLRRCERQTKLLHGTHLPNFPVNYSNEYMVGNWTNNHVKFTKTAPNDGCG